MGAVCSSSASIERSYDDLPLELLVLVIVRLYDPADRARARAVCRSWLSAVHRQGPQPWRVPSTMSQTCRLRHLPHGATSVGSTDDWLAVSLGKKDKYILHNPFFNRTIPLTELEGVIVYNKSLIYKFLMRSSVDDFIAVITNDMMFPFMVLIPGKGLWLPNPFTRPYMEIIDFAFLRGKLYAITNKEDLIPFDLALDDEGRPVVTMGMWLIQQRAEYHGHDTDDEELEVQVAAALNGITYPSCSAHYWSDTSPNKNFHLITRHLIESCGKLLMVRHHKQMHQEKHHVYGFFTRHVEIFEANTEAGTWIPVTGGLGGGRSLFISTKFSKSVVAPCGEVEEDVIYFMGTGEVFDLKSGTCRPSRLCTSSGRETWLFLPEFVF